MNRSLLLMAIFTLTLATMPRALTQGTSVDQSTEQKIEDPILPKPESMVDTPGHSVELNSDGTAFTATNNVDRVTMDMWGDLTSASGAPCEKGAVRKVRECRRFGENYAYVDVEYQEYSCGPEGQKKKGRLIKAIKVIKDHFDQGVLHCPPHQYNAWAEKAREWGEAWQIYECVAKEVTVAEGLVMPWFVSFGNDGGVVWMDQAGNKFTATYDAEGKNGKWNAAGKPPPFPGTKEDQAKWKGKWVFPGGHEGPVKQAHGTGTQHVQYPDGTDIYQKANGDVEVHHPGGSKTLIEKPDPGKEEYEIKKIAIPNPPPPVGQPLGAAGAGAAKEQQPAAPQSFLKGGGGPGGDQALKTPPDPGGGSTKSGVEQTQLLARTSISTPCPPIEIPPQAGEEQTTRTVRIPLFAPVTDGRNWCSYGDAVGIPNVLILTGTTTVVTALQDQVSPPVDRKVGGGTAKGEAAKSPSTSAPSKAPQDPTLDKKAQEPAGMKSEDARGKKPEDPPGKTTEKIPELKTPEEEPRIPDTIFVKAREAVLEEAGKTAGKEIEGQTIKLLAAKPDLPTASRKQDRGFDKAPVQCTTAADGSCKLDIPTEDRADYQVPHIPRTPKQDYRVEVEMRVPLTTGAVLETTGQRTKPDFANVPRGVALAAREFQIGNRKFTRVQSLADLGVKHSLREHFGKAGASLEEDTCRDKQPGPPFGIEPTHFTAIGSELPATVLKLARTARYGWGKQ